jgi:hypothetical protein
MPRYFLHVNQGTDVAKDLEGEEFDDLAAARQEAAGAARDLMASDLRSGQPLGLNRSIVITDESGDTIAEVSFKDALPAE